jgi:hypothetical protein
MDALAVVQSKLVLKDAAFAQGLVTANTLAVTRQARRAVTVFMWALPRS